MSTSTHEAERVSDSEKSAEDGGKEKKDEGTAGRRDEPEKTADEQEKKGDEEKSGQVEKKEKRGFPLSKKAVVIIVIVLGVLLVAGLLYWLHARQFISTDDAYTTGHVHQISPRVTGTVREVRVEDNQVVQAGEVIAQLDPRDYEVALQRALSGRQQAQAQVVQAEAKIAQTRAQWAAAQAQIGQAQAQVVQASAQLEKARSDYDRTAGLYSKDLKAVSKADVDAVTEAFESARSGVESARANLTAVQAQSAAGEANVQAAQADAEVARANVGTSEAEVKNAELQLSYCQVIAPVRGKISKKTVEPGQRVQPGQALMAVVPENVWVLANLKETELERVQIGQRVEIKIDALPHETFIGSVDSIQEGSGATFSLLPPDNATGNFTKIVQRVPVKIVFDPESIRDFRDKIVPGLSAEPTIDLESLKSGQREAQREKIEEKQNRAVESGR